MFHMARPHDLAAFINQEKRFVMLTTLKNELLNKKGFIDKQDSLKKGSSKSFNTISSASKEPYVCMCK